MTEGEAPYRPAVGDLIRLKGFPHAYRALAVSECPGCQECTVLIHLPDPPRPALAWINRMFHHAVPTSRPTWVHAVGVRPVQESVNSVDQHTGERV